ncbi:Hsp20 family protein [Scytonema sp. UIC 10036]|uniref:Hsp20/alpha crystallin family protein n=1 Tax=Scytonema sp. UIC 10036 TaxID=2304196 RepID=UPI0012DA9B4F|nr:Hsp20/alpha crystallin family protein [Scytonema sp. UIC 10036]MUG92756.1 Hsp20 family protein [Scytonema sp. UIC 10036]
MTLIRYNPWKEINAIQRLFEETRVPFEREFVKVPAAELTQTPDAVHLKLELPGMDAKDLDIQVTENTVSISGDRKSETKTEDKGITRTEFHYGKFQRVIPLPVKIQNTDVKAEYKDGILNLTLPKKEEEKNLVVKVNLEQPAA